MTRPGDVRLGASRPGARRGGRSTLAVEGAGDDRHFGRAAPLVGERAARDVARLRRGLQVRQQVPAILTAEEDIENDGGGADDFERDAGFADAPRRDRLKRVLGPG